jgi:hypothetical protein
VESTPAFRAWFVGKVGERTVLRDEQTRLASFAVVPDLDIAGARGAALAALAKSGDLIHRSSRPRNSLVGCRRICQFGALSHP